MAGPRWRVVVVGDVQRGRSELVLGQCRVGHSYFWKPERRLLGWCSLPTLVRMPACLATVLGRGCPGGRGPYPESGSSLELAR